MQKSLESELEPVNLPTGSIIAAAGRPVRVIYFPVDAVVSLLHTDDEGASAQVGLVGWDGMLGLGACFGAPHRSTALVLAGGLALRCNAQPLQDAFEHCPSVRRNILAWSGNLLGQAWQIALCNRHHAPAPQLCSLLLLVMDRGAHGELSMTHDLIARLLGLRRETISQAAMRVQERGYVRYTRGHIRVLDRQGLEEMSCGCWRSAALAPHMPPEPAVTTG
ncbi:Crp/Fnr family transcriptional regulator [Ramlibacter humi]|uniref:Crp/Fnr family transcriptional regulator n=1 Tax=Ramlibacter humi TaxID=2530451 RepID=UPI00142F5A39|nr:Crp/Fnr family transcriptional regulator [Ramlibacter humi]